MLHEIIFNRHPRLMSSLDVPLDFELHYSVCLCQHVPVGRACYLAVFDQKLQQQFNRGASEVKLLATQAVGDGFVFGC